MDVGWLGDPDQSGSVGGGFLLGVAMDYEKDLTGQTLYEPYAPSNCKRVIQDLGEITGGLGNIRDRLIVVVGLNGEVYVERISMFHDWSLERLIADHEKKIATHRTRILQMDNVVTKANLDSKENVEKILDGVRIFTTTMLRPNESLVPRDNSAFGPKGG